MLIWNEGRAVQTARSLAEGRNVVVAVEAARVDPANEGKLVHVNGDVKAVARLRDLEFLVSATGLRSAWASPSASARWRRAAPRPRGRRNGPH